jgi:arabinan endo-1,5-alpha-L-arabinosidase
MQITYQNPVWPGVMADPFVLWWQGEYYAYGTGPRAADGREFPMLHSTDFTHWELLGGALETPDSQDRNAYWAPEVAEREGRFYLYYSTAGDSGDETHRLRVAVADHPAGPFRDSGHLLLPQEDFSIDAHPFCDPLDGRWYLFFSKDFFDERVGTAISVVRLADDMVSVVRPVTTALRPGADWQVYEHDRTHYGQTWDAWHTVEGACVVVHEGLYYLIYSGGNWQSAGYGLGCAVAESVLGPYDEPELGPVVLHGMGNDVIGPGHNCVVSGPDGQTPFVVYHAWDKGLTGRRMCLDPLVWTPEGPRCAGPTWTPQTLDLPLKGTEMS